MSVKVTLSRKGSAVWNTAFKFVNMSMKRVNFNERNWSLSNQYQPYPNIKALFSFCKTKHLGFDWKAVFQWFDWKTSHWFLHSNSFHIVVADNRHHTRHCHFHQLHNCFYILLCHPYKIGSKGSLAQTLLYFQSFHHSSYSCTFLANALYPCIYLHT